MKYEIRIFSGSRTRGSRRSKNFTVQSELSLDNIAGRVALTLKTCGTLSNQKDEPSEGHVPQDKER